MPTTIANRNRKKNVNQDGVENHELIAAARVIGRMITWVGSFENTVNIVGKIKLAFRSVFAPSTVTFDERRRARMVVWSLLAGLGVAIFFGLSLYYLNSVHRF
jgi:hypothetical protein